MAKLVLRDSEWEWVNSTRKVRQMGLYGQEVFQTGLWWGWVLMNFSEDEGICSYHQCTSEKTATELCNQALLKEIEKIVCIKEGE